MTRPALALTALLLLAGCGNNKPAAAPSPSPTPSKLTGVAAFQADINRAGFGTKDTTDPGFLNVGQTTCTSFGDGVSYGEQVSVYAKQASIPQAENLVRSAVTNLCPQYESMLPR